MKDEWERDENNNITIKCWCKHKNRQAAFWFAFVYIYKSVYSLNHHCKYTHTHRHKWMHARTRIICNKIVTTERNDIICLHYRERFSSNFVDLAVLRLSYHCLTLYLLMIYRMFGVAEHVQLHRHFAKWKTKKNNQNKTKQTWKKSLPQSQNDIDKFTLSSPNDCMPIDRQIQNVWNECMLQNTEQ